MEIYKIRYVDKEGKLHTEEFLDYKSANDRASFLHRNYSFTVNITSVKETWIWTVQS